ncbi:YqeG family HAD IIIA-type phosphatase [Weissella coleopterorum]|uniref:YqeG family HAD IIIA-type phosphatase n=1 Tax=Weissella coleopterorum TaxID=2714949 RepID=A0A6G8B123_9LACO|nr:YqeG family HAD IIIA-type phosphatase [Weissella coleopterorum]QIL51008.1 YqeG family HAD IIIA-type phosphatase [Weissella coleopterorum]
MTGSFTPTWMVEAIYYLTPVELQEHGIKAILTDLDNTLIAWNNPDGTEQLHQWLQSMEKAGIPVMIVSNNSSDRIERVAKPLALPFVGRSLKPLTKGLKVAMQKLNLNDNEVVMVGDQLLTDIWAANNFGVRSILVQPLIETDQWNTKINRFFEKGVKKNMLKQNPDLQWRKNLDK